MEARKKAVQQLKRRFSDYRVALARDLYENTSAALVQQWRAEFIQTQPPILRSKIQEKGVGFENPRFRAFVMERLSLPTLEEFLKQEGIKLQEDEKNWWNQV